MPPTSVAVFSFYTDLIQIVLLLYPSVLLLLFYFAPLGINRQQRIIVLKLARLGPATQHSHTHKDSFTTALAHFILLSLGSTLSSLRAEVTNHVHRFLRFTSIPQTAAVSPIQSTSLSLPPPPRAKSTELWPPITACQAAGPDGARCQSNAESCRG